MNIEPEFFYQSQPRLQLFFESPNHCATVFGMVGLLFVGGMTRLWAPFRSLPQMIILFALPSSILIFYGLAITYSRGGWIASVLGLVVFTLLVKSGKIIPATILGIFCIFLLHIPGSPQRAMSILEIETDPSIFNRIVVWKGAVAMTSDHWLGGVGDGQFGLQFSAWYQPIGMETKYLAALNNYLTLSAEGGIFRLWGYLLLVLTPLVFVCHHAWRAQNVLMLSVVSAQVVYLISALFTCSFHSRHVTGLFLCLYVLSLTYAMVYMWKDRLARKAMKRDLTAVIVLATLVAFLVLTSGVWMAVIMPTNTVAISAQSGEGSLNGFIVRPTKREAKGCIVYFHDKGENVLETAKTILRPLAESGYSVIAFKYRAGGIDGCRDALMLAKWSQSYSSFNKVYLLGSGVGGRMAILVACSKETHRYVSAVASIDSALEWPFPELAPIEQIKNLFAPLLLIYNQDSRCVTVEQLRLIQSLCSTQKKDLTVDLLNKSLSPTDKLNIILKLDRFYQTHL